MAAAAILDFILFNILEYLHVWRPC